MTRNQAPYEDSFLQAEQHQRAGHRALAPIPFGVKGPSPPSIEGRGPFTP